MPPNLIFKAAFVRGDIQDGEKSSCGEKDTIRTEFILSNVFAHSLGKVYAFNAVRAINDKERFVFDEIKGTFDSFKASYGDNIKSLCCKIEVTEATVGAVVTGVANPLFSEGITWSTIVALFAFVGELTIQCLSQKYPDSIVDRIYECFCKLVKERLKPWVEDHGGWEGITALSVTQQENTNSLETPKSNSGWALSFLHKTVQVIGTLAHIGNTINALP